MINTRRKPLTFYYLIDLHYSQTQWMQRLTQIRFYYLIDLHYSQTTWSIITALLLFYYLIDLHYSQTRRGCPFLSDCVLLPYRFTLFSNLYIYCKPFCLVLLPYRFTLFSNGIWEYMRSNEFYYLIDLHYSQTLEPVLIISKSFYYLIDLHYSQTVPCIK